MGLERECSLVTHEEVVCVWVWTTNPEELHQVVELAMYVAADGDWAFLVQQSALVLVGKQY